MARRRSSRSTIPLLLIGGGLILILGALLWFYFGMKSQENTVRIPYPDVHRISQAEAYAAYQNGKAIFVDVRGDPYYSEGHIPGALNVPEEEISGELNNLPKNSFIITYCT